MSMELIAPAASDPPSVSRPYEFSGTTGWRVRIGDMSRLEPRPHPVDVFREGSLPVSSRPPLTCVHRTGPGFT